VSTFAILALAASICRTYCTNHLIAACSPLLLIPHASILVICYFFVHVFGLIIIVVICGFVFLFQFHDL